MRVEDAVAVPHWVPAALASTCRARTSAAAGLVVDCSPGRGVVSLQYRGFASVRALRTAFAAGPTRPRLGPPACARGLPEARSWSVATAPSVPVGRYRCSIAAGRARIVWSTDRAGASLLAGSGVAVLGVAARADDDLRSLYEWWTTVPGP